MEDLRLPATDAPRAVHASSNMARSSRRAAWSRVQTVPTGIESASAISSPDISSISNITMTARLASLKLSRARSRRGRSARAARVSRGSFFSPIASHPSLSRKRARRPAPLRRWDNVRTAMPNSHGRHESRPSNEGATFAAVRNVAWVMSPRPSCCPPLSRRSVGPPRGGARRASRVQRCPRPPAERRARRRIPPGSLLPAYASPRSSCPAPAITFTKIFRTATLSLRAVRRSRSLDGLKVRQPRTFA